MADHDCDLFVIGSELVTTESHQDEWLRTIDVVRQTYHGRITYSSNWDHYRSVGFWDRQDASNPACVRKSAHKVARRDLFFLADAKTNPVTRADRSPSRSSTHFQTRRAAIRRAALQS